MVKASASVTQATQSLLALLQVSFCDRGPVLQGQVEYSCTALTMFDYVPHQLRGFLGRLARGRDICRMGGSLGAVSCQSCSTPHEFDFCWRLSWTLMPISRERSLRCTKSQSASSLGSWSPRMRDDARVQSCSSVTTTCTPKPAMAFSLRPSNLRLNRAVSSRKGSETPKRLRMSTPLFATQRTPPWIWELRPSKHWTSCGAGICRRPSPHQNKFRRQATIGHTDGDTRCSTVVCISCHC